MVGGRYLMEARAEAERLEAKTDEDETRRQLELVGLEAGMRVLDAGCGTGAVARVMAELVGPAGDVLAVDASRDRLARGAALDASGRVRWLQSDLRRQPFAPCFDLVWSRFVLEYVVPPDEVFAELVRVTAPGGRLVVGDTDDHGLRHHPIGDELDAQLRIAAEALEGWFDPWAGRKLYGLFRRHGLTDIEVRVLPYHLYPGTAPPAAMANWEQKWRTVEPLVAPRLGGAEAYERFVAQFMALLADPDSFTYSSLVLVAGTVPRPGEATSP